MPEVAAQNLFYKPGDAARPYHTQLLAIPPVRLARLAGELATTLHETGDKA
jgi:hypothetical protein